MDKGFPDEVIRNMYKRKYNNYEYWFDKVLISLNINTLFYV